MEGGTAFHFVTDGIHAAPKRATEAASGRDIRLGGGVKTIRQYIRAGLIDEVHPKNALKSVTVTSARGGMRTEIIQDWPFGRTRVFARPAAPQRRFRYATDAMASDPFRSRERSPLCVQSATSMR
jgi:hypothetical protein